MSGIKIYICFAHLFIGVALISPVPALASVDVAGSVFDVTTDSNFAPVLATLDRLITERAAQENNHLCLLGIDDHGEKQAWVLWREAGAYILWEPRTAGDDMALVASRRYLVAGRDIVPDGTTGLDISTYQESATWAKHMNTLCAAKGRVFNIGKSQATMAVDARLENGIKR